MSKKPKMLLILAVFTSLFIVVGNGCHGVFFNETHASKALTKQTLRVGLHQDLFAKSPEKDLVNLFAKQYGIKTEFFRIETIEQANDSIAAQKAELIFIRTDLSSLKINGQPSLSYDELKISIICSNPATDIHSVYVPQNLSFITGLKKFKNKFATTRIIETRKSYLELKNKSLEERNFCFAADQRSGEKSALSYPKLKKVWQMNYAVPVSWVSASTDETFHQLFQGWFNNLVRKNKVRHIWDQYESADFQMSPLAFKRFFEHSETRLPKWKRMFKKYGKDHDVPWTLLAAVAYQESKWDAHARSYTGVRGLMQITTKTAQHLGIEDREDPQQSIKGAAFYLKYLYDKTPNNISSYERWTHALSAYNMGWAHLRDAKKLAVELNYNPYRWYEFRKVIPKLEQEKYYSKLAFGFARGRETVDFVNSVLGYYDLLNNSFTQPLLTSRDF